VPGEETMSGLGRPPSRQFVATAEQYAHSPLLAALHTVGATEAETIQALYADLAATQRRLVDLYERAAFQTVILTGNASG
jgi:hypothetical protein